MPTFTGMIPTASNRRSDLHSTKERNATMYKRHFDGDVRSWQNDGDRDTHIGLAVVQLLELTWERKKTKSYEGERGALISSSRATRFVASKRLLVNICFVVFVQAVSKLALGSKRLPIHSTYFYALGTDV